MARTSTPWRLLPARELGCGSPATAWRRLAERVERALSWLSCYRRLGVRWDRGSERWFAFVLLACALVCFNRL
jgi:hypothetical protein